MVAAAQVLAPTRPANAGAASPGQPASTPPAINSSALDAQPLDADPGGTPAPPETLISLRPPRGIPVFLGGSEVFRVRVARGGLDPGRRAAAVRGRLNQAVADLALPPDSVRLRLGPEGLEVSLGPRFLWLVTPGDVEGAELASLTRNHSKFAARVREGIARERASRRPARLAMSVLIALALTLLAWAIARLLGATGRRWRGRLHAHLGPKVPTAQPRTLEIFSRTQIASLVSATLGRVPELLMIVLLYGWLTVVLSLFPWTQGWSTRLIDYALSRGVAMLQALWRALPHLVALALVVIVFRWLSRLAEFFYDAIEDGTLVIRGYHSELTRPSRRLTGILLWIVGAVVAYPFIPGSQTRAFEGVSILLGVMLSLGSSGFVSNVIAGIVLTFSRAFHTGDRVRVGEHVGDILTLGFFATKLRTIYNEDVTLPNAQVAAGPIVNYTRYAGGEGLMLHTEVTIGYDVPWRTVHALLAEAAGRVEGIERDPAPYVRQRSLNDFHITYEIDCATHDSHAQLRLYSDLHAEIQEAFQRAGIEMLSPAYHALRNAGDKVVPPGPTGSQQEPGGFRVKRDG